MRRLLLCLFLTALAAPALASDGVLEVNQTCAVETGCFTGDAAGFPVTITQGGSYRLTGNVTVTDPATDGIEATVEEVMLDLGGFTLRGPGSGTGNGISAPDRLTVINGTVRGFGQAGVTSDILCRVEGVRISENGGSGVALGPSAILERVHIYNNGSLGIDTGEGSVVSRSVIENNNLGGILAQEGSLISESTVRANSGHGIQATGNATIRGNVVRLNQNYQIYLSAGSALGGGLIVSNSVYSQSATFAALRMLSTEHGYRDNVVVSITSGTAFGGVNMGCNLLNGAGSCP